MPDIRECPEHGYVTGDRCPVCGREGNSVLEAERRTRLSKFVSGALRHFPGDVGLELDERGWTARDDLEVAVLERYPWATPEHIDAVVATDPKGRFEADGDRIRAAYGHSVSVDLESTDGPVPAELYHGTAPENLDTILKAGLRPMSRQSVHLSETPTEACEVGRRHAHNPVVLAVDAAGMLADGHRITKRGEGVYTTERVPPEYLEQYG